MKITKKAIKDAYESTRKLQPNIFCEWDDDDEARLIYEIRGLKMDTPWSTKKEVLERAYVYLWKEDYDVLDGHK